MIVNVIVDVSTKNIRFDVILINYAIQVAIQDFIKEGCLQENLTYFFIKMSEKHSLPYPFFQANYRILEMGSTIIF